MKKLLLIAALFACSNSSKLDPPGRQMATEFAAMIPEKVIGKCTPWTKDSVLCHISDTAIMWCTAPKDGKPHCEVAVDWTPQPPKAPETKEESPSPTKGKSK